MELIFVHKLWPNTFMLLCTFYFRISLIWGELTTTHSYLFILCYIKKIPATGCQRSLVHLYKATCYIRKENHFRHLSAISWKVSRGIQIQFGKETFFAKFFLSFPPVLLVFLSFLSLFFIYMMKIIYDNWCKDWSGSLEAAIHSWVAAWSLYQMVTHKILRSHEEKWVF